MIILHPWVPGVRSEDQARCWTALAPLRDLYEVVDIELSRSDPWDYAAQLRKHWYNPQSKQALLVVEHDVAPSVELVKAMDQCPLPLCARPPGSAPAGKPVRTWLGCTKFGWEAQYKTPWAIMPDVQWGSLDQDVTNVVARSLGQYWHLHTEPLEHYHNAWSAH